MEEERTSDVSRERTKKSGRKRKKARARKGERRVLDLGQRSEIIFPLRPCSSSSISPAEGEKSTTRRFAAAAAAAAIIKLFTHTVRYLSSKQCNHNVLLFDPHFVSDLSFNSQSRDDMYLADPARPI